MALAGATQGDESPGLLEVTFSGVAMAPAAATQGDESRNAYRGGGGVGGGA
jgi:hypothetical protein